MSFSFSLVSAAIFNTQLKMISLNGVALGFHSIALAHHLYAFKFISTLDYSKTTDPRVLEMQDFGPRYITTWNLIIQIIFLLCSVYYDVYKMLPSSQKKQNGVRKLVKKYKGYLYTVIMFPTTLFVAIMFWSIFWLNRELILPEAVKDVAPNWLNHSIHTNIVVVLFGELLITRKGLPRPEFKTAVMILCAFGFIYFAQFFAAYYQFGRYIYDIYNVITWQERVALIVFNHIAALVFMKIGFSIQSYKNERVKIN